MPMVDLHVGSRRYSIPCRDGEEEHLRATAALVDDKAKEASAALGSLSEARQLLFAALLLADELAEARTAPAIAPENPAAAEALERVAERIEMLADSIENERASH